MKLSDEDKRRINDALLIEGFEGNSENQELPWYLTDTMHSIAWRCSQSFMLVLGRAAVRHATEILLQNRF